ncbi:MAG: Isonitrile hydratase [Chroococcidiopsis sp. SAG 2025]|uniref:DJ-1/PfpI family protein n=1 Tax=Chroococcidiopsis sp. SAG 2025 TaxID=171389 RepID=UPI002936EEE5|nr:DJ-1/PfpI family protein [Chroococcidiopsis sp. SAG 2025]MDV2990578.1 Isonitrile hydratase [Chroococcidiopsis sp. SAG 2025]
MTQRRNVAILIFDEVEILDFCGPYEVFGVTGKRNSSEPFNVYTVAEERRPIIARNQLSINPQYTLLDCPRSHILLVPGGFGTRRAMHNSALIDWIKERSQQAELLLSVCTGALLLAKAGLLEGLTATTHHGAIDLLKQVAPNTQVQPDKRFVDNGSIILSAGISSGIDMSLYVVARLLGEQQARETAKYMEYDWQLSGKIENYLE